jgi:hypothetical protein
MPVALNYKIISVKVVRVEDGRVVRREGGKLVRMEE